MANQLHFKEEFDSLATAKADSAILFALADPR